MPKHTKVAFSANDRQEDPLKAMIEAKELAKSPGSCIEIVSHIRTISLPWSFLGRTNDGVELVLDRMLYTFRRRLNGVPIARGKHKIMDKASIIQDDHPNFHFSAKCRLAVFRPRIGAILPGQVVHIDEGQIACSVYGVVTVNVWRTYTSKTGKKKQKRELDVNLGDKVTLKVTKAHLFRRQLQLNGEIVDDR